MWDRKSFRLSYESFMIICGTNADFQIKYHLDQ